EPPRDEFRKCSCCGVNYSIKETIDIESSDEKTNCKKCKNSLELLEFWSEDDIKKDLENALSRRNRIILVAETSLELSGFTWGYESDFDKEFPFLGGKLQEPSNYMDEIAVRSGTRNKGIGVALGREYIKVAREQGMRDLFLRTDERNVASMRLFRKLGYNGIEDRTSVKNFVYDPQYQDRIYLRRNSGDVK
ncbi:MAG: GNAT family N-acetyltransferase, partial [Nanoarchaeota archaeon]